MNTAKVYKDIEDNDCTIHQMVLREPIWAATRVQVGEDALSMVQKIKDWDLGYYQEHGKFALPERLRKQMQELSA